MKNKEALDTLHDIKELMEKSTKFLGIKDVSKTNQRRYKDVHERP